MNETPGLFFGYFLLGTKESDKTRGSVKMQNVKE